MTAGRTAEAVKRELRDVSDALAKAERHKDYLAELELAEKVDDLLGELSEINHSNPP